MGSVCSSKVGNKLLEVENPPEEHKTPKYKPKTESPTEGDNQKKLLESVEVETAEKEEKPIVEINKLKIQVLYGTQTFTSEYYADAFVQQCKLRYGMEIELSNMREYENSWKEITSGETLAVIFLSTYGDGEPTTDTVDFFKYLKTTEDDLSKVGYTIFGCGNSAYRKYQQCAIDVEKLLRKKKAKTFFKVGHGDQETLEDDYDEWQEEVLPFLEGNYGLKKLDYDDTPKPKYLIKWWSVKRKPPAPFNKVKLLPDRKRPFLSKLLVKRELLKDPGERSIMHLEFDLDGSRIMYKEGDHIYVYAENRAELIAEYVERLGVDPELMQKTLTLVPVNPLLTGYTRNALPMKTTLENAFKFYFDLTRPPKKKTIRFMAEYAEDVEEKKALMFLCSYEGKQKYSTDIVQRHLRLLDVLNMFKSVKLPLEVFMEVSMFNQPRVYSISSCFDKDRNRVSLTVAKETYQSSYDGRRGSGLCSGYLTERVDVGDSVYLFMERSGFYHPTQLDTPIMMISMGCSISTFRSFLEYRDYVKESTGAELGKASLYYGCRKRNADWIYEEEHMEHIEKGTLTSIHTAFSREKEKKVYVQDKMKENRKEIVDDLKNGALVYVCGTVRMAKSVFETLVEALIEFHEDISNEEEAEMFLEDRYTQEVTV